MNRAPIRALAVALALLAVPALAASGRDRSLAIFPPQTVPIRFNHAQHIEGGADCLTCHDAVRKSSRGSDRNLPKHPECEACHDIKKASKGKVVDPPSSCSTCHPRFDPTVQLAPAKLELPSPNLKFDHKVHLDKKIDCETCHEGVKQVELASRLQLPKMATCLQCHDGKSASAECKTCHFTLPNGRLQLDFTTVLRPMQGNPFGLDHGPRFEFNHGTRASIARQQCTACHADSYCQKCHDGMQKPLSVHPNDYLVLHPVQARVDSPRCEGCHRVQSFCVACHERSGVGLNADKSLLARNVRVHPNYELWVTTPGPLHHGIAASRDITQCISCHREETCTACHSNRERGGFKAQINPHPDGFSGACKALAAQNDRACLKCHTERALVEKGCR